MNMPRFLVALGFGMVTLYGIAFVGLPPGVAYVSSVVVFVGALYVMDSRELLC